MSAPVVVVVGAGPAGLAVSAALAARGVEVRVVERESTVGASWRSRYDGLRLNTVRWLSHLPGARLPSRAGRWVGRDDFVSYLERYAERDGVRIDTRVEVKRVNRGHGGGARWSLDTSAGQLDAAAVVVATGAFDGATPPAWDGATEFKGDMCHASAYRQPGPYRDRHVLVVGSGASGLEIAALLASGGAARVDISVRSLQNLFTREWHGIPLTPPPVAQRFPTSVLDISGWLTLRLYGADWPHPLPRAVAGLGTALRRDGREPIVADGLVEALREGRIGLVAGVKAMRGWEVHLDDGTSMCPDAVIAATGYRHGLAPLVGGLDVLNEAGAPPRPGHAGRSGLVFVGFEPTATGRLVQIRRQAALAVRAVRAVL